MGAVDRTAETIADLKAAGITYDARQYGAKYLARVKLTNGKHLMFCLFGHTVKYGMGKSVGFKDIKTFLKVNKLEIEK